MSLFTGDLRQPVSADVSDKPTPLPDYPITQHNPRVESVDGEAGG